MRLRYVRSALRPLAGGCFRAMSSGGGSSDAWAAGASVGSRRREIGYGPACPISNKAKDKEGCARRRRGKQTRGVIRKQKCNVPGSG